MLIRVEGTSLPGLRCGEPGGAMYEPVTLGAQRRQDVVFRTPADAPSVAFDLDVQVVAIDGGWDFRGPFVHGRPGDRFLYLSWGELRGEEFSMFRRAKLLLVDVPFGVVEAGVNGGGLVAQLGLTDACGMPRCGSVRAPVVSWSAGEAKRRGTAMIAEVGATEKLVSKGDHSVSGGGCTSIYP